MPAYLCSAGQIAAQHHTLGNCSYVEENMSVSDSLWLLNQTARPGFEYAEVDQNMYTCSTDGAYSECKNKSNQSSGDVRHIGSIPSHLMDDNLGLKFGDPETDVEACKAKHEHTVVSHDGTKCWNAMDQLEKVISLAGTNCMGDKCYTVFTNKPY